MTPRSLNSQIVNSTKPIFFRDQQVLFTGGSGTIKNCFPDSGAWLYQVEMELGPEPEMGRMGAEATILLHQTEIQPLLA